MERKRHNSGIALVMVLGILSVMIIMAVAFAISMRTERVAAGNYADSVRARQLVQVGITRAMNRIQQDLSHNFFTVNAGSDILFVSRPYQTGMPVVVSSTGTLPSPLLPGPSPLSPGTIYYTIYVSDTQIRLASSYFNAKSGVPINIINNGSGQHSIQLWLEVVSVSLIDNTLEWDHTFTNFTLNTGTRIVLSSDNTFPSPLTNTSYYAIYVTNTQIKVASSYQKALNGEAIDITAGLPGSGHLYISQNGQVYPPWDAFSSYGTNFMTQVSQVKSENFTKQIDYLKVRGRYSLGDKVSVTSTEILPTPLMEDTPYYVVSILSNGIRLGTSYPGPPLAVGPDLGGTHAVSHYSSTGRSFIPGALWNHIAQVDSAAATNYWEKIEMQIAESNYATVGRVAYLIANCSGLLDANSVGSDGSIRSVGTNPSELAIGYMPEFKPAAAGATAFLARRDGIFNPDCLYETLVELAVLNSNAFYGCPSNFTVYSHCPPGYWATNPVPAGVQTKVNLSGTASNIYDRRIQITEALINIGIPSPDAYIIWRNLMDYIDTDSIPTDSYASVESVPMINEIVVSNVVVQIIPGTNRMDTTMYFELWYPFVTDSTEDFELQYRASFNIADASSDVNFVPANINAWRSLPLIVHPGAQSFAVRSDSLPSITNAAGNGNVYFTSTITARVVLAISTAEVDQVQGVMIVNSNNLAVLPSVNVAGSECLDPRFNWYLTQWQPSSLITLSNINDWTQSFLSTNYDGDTNTEMFVANAPLHSVAELGYLVYSSNAPWQTIKLYGTNFHRVLDVFAIDNNSSSADFVVTNRGLVNPNSRQMGALATVFADMPVNEYRGGPSGPSNRLSMASALTIAGRLHTGGFFTNLSDIGRGLTNFSGLTNMVGTPLPVFSELQKESFFRNSCGLLNLRQNLFAIIIEAQVASGGNIPRNPVRQRAVVLVWRDPYTGEMFKRNITWLRD